MRVHLWLIPMLMFLVSGCSMPTGTAAKAAPGAGTTSADAAPAQKGVPSGQAPVQTRLEAAPSKIIKTDAEWKRLLTPEQYRVLRQDGTERAFTGA